MNNNLKVMFAATRGETILESDDRFYVKAGSVNEVRRALHRAPGGVRVIGRFDRDTVECRHTMASATMTRTWPILQSRLQKAGLTVVARPGYPSSGEPSSNADGS